MHLTSSQSTCLLSPSITHSAFHPRLKTYNSSPSQILGAILKISQWGINRRLWDCSVNETDCKLVLNSNFRHIDLYNYLVKFCIWSNHNPVCSSAVNIVTPGSWLKAPPGVSKYYIGPIGQNTTSATSFVDRRRRSCSYNYQNQLNPLLNKRNPPRAASNGSRNAPNFLLILLLLHDKNYYNRPVSHGAIKHDLWNGFLSLGHGVYQVFYKGYTFCTLIVKVKLSVTLLWVEIIWKFCCP